MVEGHLLGTQANLSFVWLLGQYGSQDTNFSGFFLMNHECHAYIDYNLILNFHM